MQIEMSAEVLLKQLKLSVTEKNIKQAEMILANTKGLEYFYKHLFSFNDNLAHIDGFIAPSSSVDLLKVKFHGSDETYKKNFHEAVEHFAKKYKVAIDPVEGKDTYYIKGIIAA